MGIADGYTPMLLRMVDELTDRLRYWTEMSTQLGIKASGYRSERDELRAKLAEAEKEFLREEQHARSQRERAEAAVARVKELELAVRSVAAGHGDIR